MIREAIATGETVDKALEKACKELGVASYEAEFEVLKFPEKKLLGLFGGSLAEVRAYIKTSPADIASKYLFDIFAKMGINDIKIEAVEEESGVRLILTGKDTSFIIGHRGETLDALQYLSGLVANTAGNSYCRIMLDVGNYREKRKEVLERLGHRMAERAIKSKRNFYLEPMNPYERRIIHTAIQGIEGAKSWSEGEDAGRHVVIGPADGEVINRRRPGNRNSNYYGGKKYGDKKKPYPKKEAEGAEKEKPIENKTDAGITQLYGRIEKN